MRATAVSPFVRLRESLQTELNQGYDELIARLTWDRPAIRRHQRARLRGLLHAAAEHSPFHARRLAGIDVDSIDPEDLTQLPVMTKSDLMGSFDDVVTDRRVTRAVAEEALAGAVEEPAVIADDALVMTSGGSSGPRGVFVLDPGAGDGVADAVFESAFRPGSVAATGNAAEASVPEPLQPCTTSVNSATSTIGE